MLIKGYNYLNEYAADPRTNDWFLMSSPWPTITLAFAYLYFVTSLGPKLMEKRKAFDIVKIIQLYNLVQIILNGYLFQRALSLGWLKDYSYRCEPLDTSWSPRAVQVARCVWLYYMLKILDLCDTIFFILRKKPQQASFLHVYHHVGMVIAAWIATKYLPGGHITSLGLINSFVHVVMYSYYLISTIRPIPTWWKKHITQLQITQFVLILIHFSQLLFTWDCAFPKWPIIVFLPQNIFIIVLFGEFYYKTYVRPSPVKGEKQTQNGPSAERNAKETTKDQ